MINHHSEGQGFTHRPVRGPLGASWCVTFLSFFGPGAVRLFENFLGPTGSAGAWIPGEDTKCSWEDEDGVLFYSTEKIKAGDELFHHYIDSSAIRLLSYHGFTEKGNILPMQFSIPEIRL